ncbi:MAG: MATE family efflux transporter [Planctomycetes bacterium]|nr:MATE family efflux transporter [Planctomycetota bacterium]
MTDQSSLLSSSDGEDPTSIKYMLKLAAPMVVTTISFTIMQFVDRFMVSRLGPYALAAILPAGAVSFLPGGFAIGLMTSLNTFVSQSHGRGDKRDCSNYFWQAIYMGFVYFLVVVAIMWPAARWIFETIMGQKPDVVDPNVVDMEVTYLRIMLYAHIPAIFNYAGSQFFMGIHRPVITMCASLCGQVVNVTANYVLIFGKLGFPEMGIAGAGWGTFIGITVAAGINLAVFLSGRMDATYKTRRALGLDFSKMYDLLKVGFPAGIGLMVNVALWGVILFGLVGKFGTEALTATSAVFACTHVSVMPIVGISTALTAAVGKAIGESRERVAIKQTRICLKVALVYMGLVGVCFFIFRKGLMEFWTTDPEMDQAVVEAVVKAGANILICAAIYQVFQAARTIYSGSLRGAGDTVWLAITSSVGAVLILGFGGAIMVRFFQKFFPSYGYMGPWIAATLSMIAVGLANRWRFKSKRWMNIDLFKRRGPSVPIQNGAAVE